MEIKLTQVKVRELTQGYEDNAENGVRAYDGKLDVRPPYQREFVYKEKQRDAVIDTLTQAIPHTSSMRLALHVYLHLFLHNIPQNSVGEHVFPNRDL